MVEKDGGPSAVWGALAGSLWGENCTLPSTWWWAGREPVLRDKRRTCRGVAGLDAQGRSPGQRSPGTVRRGGPSSADLARFLRCGIPEGEPACGPGEATL